MRLSRIREFVWLCKTRDRFSLGIEGFVILLPTVRVSTYAEFEAAIGNPRMADVGVSRIVFVS